LFKTATLKQVIHKRSLLLHSWGLRMGNIVLEETQLFCPTWWPHDNLKSRRDDPVGQLYRWDCI